MALAIGRYNQSGVSTNASLSATQSRENCRPFRFAQYRECAAVKAPQDSPKSDGHDSGTKLHVCFPVESVHVVLEKVPDIMQREGRPQTNVPREPVQPPPGDGEEPGVNHYTMCAV